MLQDQAPESDSPRTLFCIDVDDCLIFDRALGENYALAKDQVNFNLTLMQVLQERGVSEVVLVSSMKLNIASKASREVVGYISRFNLIEKMAEYGIQVKQVVSNYDMAIDPETNKQYEIGQYYEKHIKPYEKMVADNPEINPENVPSYVKQYAWQRANSNFVMASFTQQKLGMRVASDCKHGYNIKHALFDRIFADSPERIVFIDDKDQYITAAEEMGEKHGKEVYTHKITCHNEDACGAQNKVSRATLTAFIEPHRPRTAVVKVLCKPEELDSLALTSGTVRKMSTMSSNVSGRDVKLYIPLEFNRFDFEDHLTERQQTSRWPLFSKAKTTKMQTFIGGHALLIVIDASIMDSAKAQLLTYLSQLKHMESELNLKITAVGNKTACFCDWVNEVTGQRLLASRPMHKTDTKLLEAATTVLDSRLCRDLARIVAPTDADGVKLAISGKALAPVNVKDLFDRLNKSFNHGESPSSQAAAQKM